MEDKELLQAILAGMQTMQTTMTEMRTDISGLKQAQEATNQRLDTMDQRFDKMDQRFDKMDQRFDKMDQRFDKTDQRLDKIEEETRHTRVLIEKDVKHEISIIAEQHSDIIDRLKKLEPLTELTGRVRVLERVVTSHTEQINELRKAQ